VTSKLAQLADSARVDWVGLGLAGVALAAYLLGVDIDTAFVLLSTILASFGRGVAITAKRRAQQEHLIEIAKGAAAMAHALKEPLQSPDPEPASDEDTRPIETEERQG
jgi:hypothetical protein